jgi:hypothetical protein
MGCVGGVENSIHARGAIIIKVADGNGEHLTVVGCRCILVGGELSIRTGCRRNDVVMRV